MILCWYMHVTVFKQLERLLQRPVSCIWHMPWSKLTEGYCMPWERENKLLAIINGSLTSIFITLSYSVGIPLFEKTTATPANWWPFLTTINYPIHSWIQASLPTEGKRSLSSNTFLNSYKHLNTWLITQHLQPFTSTFAAWKYTYVSHTLKAAFPCVPMDRRQKCLHVSETGKACILVPEVSCAVPL